MSIPVKDVADAMDSNGSSLMKQSLKSSKLGGRKSMTINHSRL